MYGDPEEVRRAARRASSIAEELREEARRTAGLADVPWRSTQADQWRHELEEAVLSIRRDAEAADAVAEALLEHAAACERTLATIASARNAFLRRLDEARGVLARAADGVVDAADDVADAAVEHARNVVNRSLRMPGVRSLDWLNF